MPQTRLPGGAYLVVDDNDDAAQSTALLLRLDGHGGSRGAERRKRP